VFERARASRRHDALRHSGLPYPPTCWMRKFSASLIWAECSLQCRVGRTLRWPKFAKTLMGIPRHGGAIRRALPIEDSERRMWYSTALSQGFNDGAQHVGKRSYGRGGDTSIDVATWRVASAYCTSKADRAEHAHPPGAWRHDWRSFGQAGAEVTLTSIFNIDKMQANKHEIEQALAEGIEIRGGMAPIGIVRGADGRATALRSVSAKQAGWRQTGCQNHRRHTSRRFRLI